MEQSGGRRWLARGARALGAGPLRTAWTRWRQPAARPRGADQEEPGAAAPDPSRRCGTSGGFGRGQWLAVLALVLLGWLYMSANTIKPDENGLVLRLGTYHRTVGPGLHFVFWPVERIEKLPVEAENQIDFGGGKGEGLMLAGDQNIVDIALHRSVEDQGSARISFQYQPSRSSSSAGGRGKRHARDRRPHAGRRDPHPRPPGRPGPGPAT